MLMLAMRMDVGMGPVRMGGRDVGMIAESVRMAMTLAARLLDHVIEPEENKRAAGNPWKPAADLLVQRDTEPGNEHAEDRSEENVTGSGEGRDHEGFRTTPFLDTSRHHERQPVGRNSRMKKRDSESCDCNRGEDRLVHLGRYPHIPYLATRSCANPASD